MSKHAMSRWSFSLITLAVLALIGVPSIPRAEENLLWKATNSQPATVVPAYTGSGSPFPVTVTPEPVSDTSLIDELTQQRNTAYANARSLLDGGRSLQANMGGLSIGGIIEGVLGPKVLINNQWLGVGEKLPVRQSKTPEIEKALKELEAMDAEAAQTMRSSINARLQADPVINLTMTNITSQTLYFKSPYGSFMFKIENSH